MNSLAEKYRLLKAGDLQVKGEICLVPDPSKCEVRLKPHRVPFNIQDHSIRTALEGLGEIEEGTR